MSDDLQIEVNTGAVWEWVKTFNGHILTEGEARGLRASLDEAKTVQLYVEVLAAFDFLRIKLFAGLPPDLVRSLQVHAYSTAVALRQLIDEQETS